MLSKNVVLLHTTHFDKSIVLPLLGFETFGFIISVSFLHFEQYDSIFFSIYTWIYYQIFHQLILSFYFVILPIPIFYNLLLFYLFLYHFFEFHRSNVHFSVRYFSSSFIVIVNYLWLISVTASDIVLSILYGLLLPNIKILLCFFFFFSLFLKVYFAIPVLTENIKLRFALVILTGAQITVANKAIKMLPLHADKTSTASSAFEIVNVVVPDLWILFLIAASVADAAAVNPNGIKTLLADSLSMSFTNVKPVFCNVQEVYKEILLVYYFR